MQCCRRRRHPGALADLVVSCPNQRNPGPRRTPASIRPACSHDPCSPEPGACGFLLHPPSSMLGTRSASVHAPSPELDHRSSELDAPSPELHRRSSALDLPSFSLDLPSPELGPPSAELGPPSVKLDAPGKKLGASTDQARHPSLETQSGSLRSANKPCRSCRDCSPIGATYSGYLPSGGCHSSTLLPSGSMTQPNLPYSDSSVLSSTSHPSARSAARSACRSATR